MTAVTHGAVNQSTRRSGWLYATPRRLGVAQAIGIPLFIYLSALGLWAVIGGLLAVVYWAPGAIALFAVGVFLAGLVKVGRAERGEL